MRFPGDDLTLTQLLFALNNKLEDLDMFKAKAQFSRQQVVKLETDTRHSLQQILAFQNEYNPINRMPPETLALIFRFVVSEARRQKSSRWIAISHVCQHWRRTSLYFPDVWSLIDSTFPTIAHMCLERSKSAPIDVWLRHDCRKDFVQRLLPHARRISALWVTLPSHYPPSLLSFFDGVSLPMLRTISVHVCGRKVAAPLFPLQCPPSLRYLMISRFSLGPSSRNITNLTALHLFNDDPVVAPSMTQFLDTLEANSNLVDLVLSSSGPRENGGDPGRIVSLNSLQVLILDKCAVQSILSHLSLPPTTDVTVLHTDVSASQGFVEQTLPDSLAHLPNTHHIDIIGFRHNGSTTCSIDAWNAGGGSVAIKARCSYDDPLWVDFIPRSMCSLQPLSVLHVRELWLEYIYIRRAVNDEEFVKGAFTTLFSSLPALNKLVMVKCKGDYAFQALMPLDDKVLCPSLATLILHDNADVDGAVLRDLAMERKSRGSAFETISISISWKGSELDVISLRDYVEHVDYKGLDDFEPFQWPFMDFDQCGKQWIPN